MPTVVPPWLKALQNPALYDHPVTGFRLVETHISWVLLTGPYAYKIKKPVKLGFLDFSRLEKRRFYCEEEVRINRRLCPDLYEGVVALTGNPHHPTISGQEPSFEYMVKLKQFDEDLLWDRMLDQGKLGPEQLDELAVLVARFHAQAPVAASNSSYGRPEIFWASVESTLAHSESPDRLLVERIAAWLKSETHRLSNRMIQRRNEGRVREGHGDLHLRNIALYSRTDPKILVFDGIEFDPNLRWIDVINEIAFLTMDLEHRGRADLAWRFLNAYLEITGDYDGLDLLRFYATNRALIRANVMVIQASQEKFENERVAFREQAEQFLRLAGRYAGVATPRLYITHGLSGSGKTTWTKILAEQWGAIRIRSDIERKRLYGLAPEASSTSEQKQTLYGVEANRRTYDRLKELAHHLLKAGYSVIVDAAFLKRAERDAFRELGDSLKTDFKILDFPVDEDVLRTRIQFRMKQGKDASEADLAVLEFQIRHQEDLTDNEKNKVLTFQTRGIAAHEKMKAEGTPL